MEEFEIKFLEVNVPELEQKLVQIGAEKVGETLTQVENFDFSDYKLKAKYAWIRLRTEFGKTTLTYKERQGVTSEDGSTQDQGMKEIEVEVENFHKTKELLLSIGLMVKFSQERKRMRWTKEDVVFDIDTWPLVPTYVEIEGPSLEKIRKISKDLGFEWDKGIVGSFSQVCGRYGFSDHDYKVLTFKEQIRA